MKLFRCKGCGHRVFFENHQCLRCGASLGYDSRRQQLLTLERVSGQAGQPDATYRQSPTEDGVEPRQGRYRYCVNAGYRAGCNWLIQCEAEQEPAEEHCESCRLTRVRPNDADENARDGWLEIERAKRRLLYTLYDLGLPVSGKTDETPHGLAFEILRGTEQAPVTTGHAEGLITINVAEGNSSFRENQREKLGEAYRTVLGHLRHEIGHYYWNELVREDEEWLARVRELFGDEQLSYQEAIERHYSQGPPPGWDNEFISAYASMHPWEDWAETWAHYLHLVDTMETASAYGVAATAPSASGTQTRVVASHPQELDFEQLHDGWYSLTFVLNSLARSMGAHDLYPFSISEPVSQKLRLIHGLIRQVESRPSPSAI